jgi:hypothetical protein
VDQARQGHDGLVAGVESQLDEGSEIT